MATKTSKTQCLFVFLSVILMSVLGYAQEGEPAAPATNENSVAQTAAPQSPPTTLPTKRNANRRNRDLRIPPAPVRSVEVVDRKEDSAASSALSTEEIFKSLDYPELQVVPRATERLQLEAQNESELGWLTHWPVQLSALSTLYLGMNAKGKYNTDASDRQKQDADKAATAALAVGGFWLVTPTVFTFMKPYNSGLNKIRRNRDRDRKGELLRERMAEEALESEARTMKTLVRLSIVSQLIATIYVASNHNDSVSQAALAAGLLAFTPYIFQHRYITTWEKHLEYKRKIYVPLTSMQFMPDGEGSNKFYPQVTLQWNF